ncbi:vomeronasal type-2 receptor 26-like [Lissotriton helveticus]
MEEEVLELEQLVSDLQDTSSKIPILEQEIHKFKIHAEDLDNYAPSRVPSTSTITDFITPHTITTMNYILIGDLNFHLDSTSEPNSTTRWYILTIIGLKQLISTPTHWAGHILDPIFAAGYNVYFSHTTQPPWTDHYCCPRFESLNYQWLQGMTFAIEEINSNPVLLPNITLGFWIYDSCKTLKRVLEGTMWMLTGQEETISNYRCKEKPQLVGVVGDSASTRSMLMARLLGLYWIPQSPYFVNSLKHIRVLQKEDCHRAPDIVWPGGGQQFLSIDIQFSAVHNVFHPSSDKNLWDTGTVHKLKPSMSIQLMDVPSWFDSLKEVLIPENIRSLNIECLSGSMQPVDMEVSLGQALDFALSELSVSYFSTNPLLSDRKQFPSFFRTIPSDDFQSLGLAQLVMHFGWTWVGLLAEDSDYGQQGIQIVKQELMKAGVCIAFSLNIILGKTDRNGFHITQVIRASTATAIVVFCLDADLAIILDEMVLHYIKNVQVWTKAGDNLHFDKNGNPHAQYNVVNWQRNAAGTISHTIVGRFLNLSAIPAALLVFGKLSGLENLSAVSNSTECVRCPLNLWPNWKQNHCIPKTVEFLSHNDSLGSILLVTGTFLAVLPLSIFGLFIHYRNTPIIKANNVFLSYLLLLSLSLCFLCSLVFIGYPTTEKCLIRQSTFGIIFALCISCILAKTITVVVAFRAINPNSNLRRLSGPNLSYMAISVCTLIQVLLCVCWLILSPPYSDYNFHSEPGKIIIECNEGSSFALWSMLGYLVLLAFISFIVAFLARKLPDSFNEAQFITFSMLAFLSIWVSFIPAYLSTKGKYMVAMEIFSIQSSTLVMFLCIFFPKCYIILIRPDYNTKEHLMGRKVAKDDIKVE